MQGIGIDLESWQGANGLLEIHAQRPSTLGLEAHLIQILEIQRAFAPQVVIIDPITSLLPLGTTSQIRAMLARLIDFFKKFQVTALFTNLGHAEIQMNETAIGISSLMDVWIALMQSVDHHYRRRLLTIVKSRGIACSDEVRTIRIGDHGITLEAAVDRDRHAFV